MCCPCGVADWLGFVSPQRLLDGNDQYWLIGDNNKKVWRYDGATYTDISPTSVPFEGKIYAIGYGDGYWIVGDEKGVLQQYNGTSWTDLTDAVGFDRICSVKWNTDFGYWLINGNKVTKTYDGDSWTDISSPDFESEIWALDCNGSTWFVGDKNGVVQANNGSAWTLLPEFGTDINAIAWSSTQQQYLVGGKDGTIKTYNGTSWTDVSTGWSASHIYAIEWCDEYAYWLVGGKDGMIKSYTGISWTDRTSTVVTDDVRAISIEGGD